MVVRAAAAWAVRQALAARAASGGAEPKCQTPQEMLRCDKVLNIAHRGGRRIRPEHTLLAYDQALADGADVLELDVNETIDGVLVVMHDRTVDRTTDCSGAIKDMTFDEIRECDAGYNFSPDGGRNLPVPRHGAGGPEDRRGLRPLSGCTLRD